MTKEHTPPNHSLLQGTRVALRRNRSKVRVLRRRWHFVRPVGAYIGTVRRYMLCVCHGVVAAPTSRMEDAMRAGKGRVNGQPRLRGPRALRVTRATTRSNTTDLFARASNACIVRLNPILPKTNVRAEAPAAETTRNVLSKLAHTPHNRTTRSARRHNATASAARAVSMISETPDPHARRCNIQTVK